MGTPRRKIPPRRRSLEVPQFTSRLREMLGPDDDADVAGYWAWRDGGEVPGLPLFKDCTESLLRLPLRGGWRRHLGDPPDRIDR